MKKAAHIGRLLIFGNQSNRKSLQTERSKHRSARMKYLRVGFKT